VPEYMTKEACEELRRVCPIGAIVGGEHGLANEHEDVKDAIRKLENRLARIEVLIPFVTVALMKLLDFLLARVTMAATP
jgi:flavoprotein